MIIGYLIIISAFSVCILWLLYKFAVQRAKYLVNMELGLLRGNFIEGETKLKVEPVIHRIAPFDGSINEMGAKERKSCIAKNPLVQRKRLWAAS